MDSRLAYGIVAFIQGRAASIQHFGKLPTLAFEGSESLLAQLQKPDVATPRKMRLDVNDLLDFLDLTGLMGDGDPIDRIFGPLIDKPGDTIRKLVEAKSPAEARAALRGFFEQDIPATAQAFAETIKPLLQRQVGVALSFVTTLKNVGSQALWEGVAQAHGEYFFGETGYVTVDGIPVLPPMHFGTDQVFDPATLHVDLDKIKGFFSEKTAQRYVRDLIRVTVEAADDVRYDDMRSRYAKIPARVGDQNKMKAFRWFKGISSLAESAVTSAVEEACLGVAQFQTNALIAASAGTYAGTAARKAAQHVFLLELGL